MNHNRSAALERSVKITGGLKPVLRFKPPSNLSLIKPVICQACHWLESCGKKGITLNADKFVFAEDNIEFAGFEITADSVGPCKRYLQVILEFHTPKNITDVRS